MLYLRTAQLRKKVIGLYAFYNCQALSNVDFGNAVTSIGSFAFMIDKSLESIEFPDSLESIGRCAFSCYDYGTTGSYFASNLKSVKFGSGLKSIADYAFYENRALNTVKFTGVALTSIGSESFCNIAITELDLSGTDTSIDRERLSITAIRLKQSNYQV